MPLSSLFLDLNSYFASVEQQVTPALRGRPIAVAPVTSDSGCCIAASIEAKKFGVKTGTRVGEARRLCPGLTIVDARPRLYVLMHQRILEAVDQYIPIDKVHSIDEVSCRLDRTQRTPERARELSMAIKSSIRARCGVVMRCSIGIAPNRVLAKLGTDMQKPDGLVILEDADLPGRIAHLSAQELCGIGPRMMKRLDNSGIRTIGHLYERDEKEMERLWGGVLGARWWRWLRGMEVHEAPTRKSSIGHSHVLAPRQREFENAKTVAERLLLKAAARMRHDGYAARRLSLGVNFVGDKGTSGWGATHWGDAVSLGEGCADSSAMMESLLTLWERVPRDRPPLLVGLTLQDLIAEGNRTLPLFTAERKRGNISTAMDKINSRFGANTLYTANIQDARQSASGGIAFNFVPDLSLADSVGDRVPIDGVIPAGRRMTDAESLALIEKSVEMDNLGANTKKTKRHDRVACSSVARHA